MKVELPFAGLILVLAITTPLYSQEAWPGTSPNQTVQWVDYPVGDPISDQQPLSKTALDIVGVSNTTPHPYVLQMASSLTSMFFRMQIGAASGWSVGTYDVFLATASAVVGVIKFSITNNPADPAVTYSLNDATGTQLVAIAAPSSFSQMAFVRRVAINTSYSYVDMQLPRSLLATYFGVQPSDLIRFVIGTGGGNNVSLDADRLSTTASATVQLSDFGTMPFTTISTVSTGVLPVELSAFSVHALSSGVVKLTWRTESELNNVGFEVQRSAVGGVWKAVSFVPGHGTSFHPCIYHALDTIPPEWRGAVRYRLRQIDRDGNYEFSHEHVVRSAPVTSMEITDVTPNPARANATISFFLPREDHLTLAIHDVSGRIVDKPLDNEFHAAGVHARTVPVNGLPSGRYLIVLKGTDGQISRSIVVTR